MDGRMGKEGRGEERRGEKRRGRIFFPRRNICGGHHTIAMVLQTGTLLTNFPALREIVSGFAALSGAP